MSKVIYQREFRRREKSNSELVGWWVRLTDEGGHFALQDAWVLSDGLEELSEIQRYTSPEIAIEDAVDRFLSFRAHNWEAFGTCSPRERKVGT